MKKSEIFYRNLNITHNMLIFSIKWAKIMIDVAIGTMQEEININQSNCKNFAVIQGVSLNWVTLKEATLSNFFLKIIL